MVNIIYVGIDTSKDYVDAAVIGLRGQELMATTRYSQDQEGFEELVGNALRHSQANMIMVKIDISDTNVQVSVEDNGKGIDMESFEDEGGMGLKVIRDRVEMLGGYFNLESLVEDGTRVIFQVPAGKTAVIG